MLMATLMALATLALQAANKQENVETVSEQISLTTAVDYHISSATPFSASGQVDIVDTDNAVLILDKVRPSQMTSAIFSHILINGVTAQNGRNCQVRIYDRGCIILPYGDSTKPLTLFTGLKQQGESCSDFGLESDNGFMNTLTEEKLNNRAQSFTLRRGYMVTFSTMAKGKGYSQCFIADTQNLSINLPTVLSGRVTSYRIFKWNNVNKNGWGGNQADINTALNSTWCYDWGAGNVNMANTEYVTHHHNKWWPGFDEVGRNGTSAHALGNNEPDNTNDPNEIATSVAEVLDTWPEMMATGKRLGSPAVAGNTDWLSEFMDSIDARGWRCDFVAVHAYWYSTRWDWEWLLNEYHNNYGNGRPIWITEMNWGAGWTGWPNANRDANSQNYQTELDGFRPILEFLAECDYVERYAPFNLWEDCYKFHNGGDASLASKQYLTPIGQYYSTMNPGLAYKEKNAKTPAGPRMVAPTKFKPRGADSKKGTVRFEWLDSNGEFNIIHELQRMNNDESPKKWISVGVAKQKEGAATYTITDTIPTSGNYSYRVRIVTYNRKTFYSPVLTYDLTTGLDHVETTEAEQPTTIFNLKGQQLKVPEQGINIINGKKILM